MKITCTNITQRKKKQMNKTILEQIHETLLFDRNEDTAKIYGLNNVDDKFEFKLINSHGDIYSLIDNVDDDKLHAGFEYLGIITYGWAAPVSTTDDDTPPSKNPERKRVRLMLAASPKESKIIGSSLEIDGQDSVFDEDESASGPLMDHFRKLIA